VNYGFLIHGELNRDRLAAALASMLSLPADAVDVGDEGDDDRNWDAPVSCTVTPLAGDLQWHLDVYTRDTVRSTPPEPVAASWLARQLHTVVAYEAVPNPPSAYWLVGPDGRRTRARIHEQDSDDIPVYRIDAVEHPQSALPGLPVTALPEVIRSYRMPTPVTDRLRETLQSQLGAQWEAAEKATRHAVTRLSAWESMVSRLVEEWPPDGWYPAAYYREDLETRDELDNAQDTLPEPVKDEVMTALAEVDRRFAEATDEDGGQALMTETGPLPRGASDAWWWRRIPHPRPWQNTPAKQPPGEGNR